MRVKFDRSSAMFDVQVNNGELVQHIILWYT
jgi:hypothetical protein